MCGEQIQDLEQTVLSEAFLFPICLKKVRLPGFLRFPQNMMLKKCKGQKLLSVFQFS